MPGITIALFLAWKVALVILTAQPVPANDSFFYDGPVVNQLLHGRYCNPALVEVMPISGGEVFSAYPPLHQFALWLWMKVAGTSAVAAMWYHVLWLAVFALALWTVLRRLGASAAAINWAGLFLFAITFHDRPDTIAQAMGTLAVCALVTGWRAHAAAWHWPAAVFLLLTFSASLQIGGIYFGLLGLLIAGRWLGHRQPFPWLPIGVFSLTLGALVALVKLGFPHLWAGFQEHLQITPSVTGWRMPSVNELLKVGRASAGIFLVTGLVFYGVLVGQIRLRTLREQPAALLCVSGVLAALALVTGCLTILAPNTIHIANYLQPLIVGCFLAIPHDQTVGTRGSRLLPLALAMTVGLVSIRAVGMSTWGVWCARDCNYAAAMELVRKEIQPLRGEQPIAVASAYLYEAARVSPVRWVHSDWIGNTGGGRVDLEPESLFRLRPQKLILTQFDYYRRYGQILDSLKARPDRVQFQIRNHAHVAPPDANPRLQKIVQHLSWAPVIVDFTWPQNTQN